MEIDSGFTSRLFLKPKEQVFLLLNNRKLSIACIAFWINRLGIKQRMCWNKLYWNQNRINDICIDLVCCLVALMH